MGTNISTTIDIGATPERVWAVLTDFASYPAWNPVFCEASGELAVGIQITLKTIQPRNDRTMTVKVKVVAARPAAEPRPGPTGMPFSRDQLMKSQMMRKYAGNPMSLMTPSS